MEKYVYFKPRNPSTKVVRRRSMEDNLEEGVTYRFEKGVLVPVQPVQHKLPVIHIRPNGVYKARDGRKIQVFAINKGSVDKTVVGMIQTEGIWEARYWNLQGLTKVPYGAGNDIIAEWSEG